MCDGQSAALREWALTSSPLSDWDGGLESWDRGWEAPLVAGPFAGLVAGACAAAAARATEALWGLVRVRESGNVRDGRGVLPFLSCEFVVAVVMGKPWRWRDRCHMLVGVAGWRDGVGFAEGRVTAFA